MSVTIQQRAKLLRIDIVVHGRLHAFHLARALIARGHDVRLYTNYPAWAAAQFGIPPSSIRSFVSHAIASRLHNYTLGRVGVSVGQPALHIAFGRWAAERVRAEADLIYVFSSVAEEILQRVNLQRLRGGLAPRVWLVRGSSHVRTQYTLLAAEERRAGKRLDKPTPWTIAREEREYAMADYIVTLSTFSLRSFQERADCVGKAFLLLSAVDASRFKPTAEIIKARLKRIENSEPLRVLTVGTFSFRKGALDIATAARELAGRMSFRFVGDLPLETSLLQQECAQLIDLVPRVPEYDLVKHYAWADIFLFPTIEDGFPAVIAQAQAAGLPVITTPNGSGPDLIATDKSGWLLPIRRPDAIVSRLCDCDADRAGLEQRVLSCCTDVTVRDWCDMARDLEIRYAAQQLDTTKKVSKS